MFILATQQKFDKDIPVVFGNAEYNTERQLLITIDEIIRQSGIEKTVMKYFLDAGRVNKMIAVFGTDKPTRLTADEVEFGNTLLLAEQDYGLIVLSHNLWVLARLKLAQQQDRLKQAA